MLVDTEPTTPIERISTGIPELDLMLEGGFPLGSLNEIIGPTVSGKTALAAKLVANATANGKLAMFIDTDNRLDPNYAEQLGLDSENVVNVSGLEAWEMCFALIEHNVDLIVVDEWSGLTRLLDVGEYDQLLNSETDPIFVNISRVLHMWKKLMTTSMPNTAVVFMSRLNDRNGMWGKGTDPETGGPGSTMLRINSSNRISLKPLTWVRGQGSNLRIKGTLIKARHRRHDSDHPGTFQIELPSQKKA